MPIKMHLLNSSGVFDNHVKAITESFQDSIRAITKILQVDNVDVVIQHSVHVIPETGMVGYSPTADRAFLSIDPENKNLSKSFGVEFLATLGHELHHCSRHNGPGYGKTLKEALISEGLACHFETELRDGAGPFYASTLSRNECSEFFKRMSPELEIEKYNHNAWFFGSKKLKIPKHCGYSVDYNLVNNYIAKNNIAASKLWSTSAVEILS